MANLKTVRIRSEGFEHGLLINESEYDSEKHELFESSGEGPGTDQEPRTDQIPEPNNEDAVEGPDPKLAKPDLMQWAKVRNLDLGEVTANHRKDEILSAIQTALKPA